MATLENKMKGFYYEREGSEEGSVGVESCTPTVPLSYSTSGSSSEGEAARLENIGYLERFGRSSLYSFADCSDDDVEEEEEEEGGDDLGQSGFFSE